MITTACKDCRFSRLLPNLAPQCHHPMSLVKMWDFYAGEPREVPPAVQQARQAGQCGPNAALFEPQVEPQIIGPNWGDVQPRQVTGSWSNGNWSKP